MLIFFSLHFVVVVISKCIHLSLSLHIITSFSFSRWLGWYCNWIFNRKRDIEMVHTKHSICLQARVDWQRRFNWPSKSPSSFTLSRIIIKIQIKFHYSSPHDIQFKTKKKWHTHTGENSPTSHNKNLLFTIFSVLNFARKKKTIQPTDDPLINIIIIIIIIMVFRQVKKWEIFFSSSFPSLFFF